MASEVKRRMLNGENADEVFKEVMHRHEGVVRKAGNKDNGTPGKLANVLKEFNEIVDRSVFKEGITKEQREALVWEQNPELYNRYTEAHRRYSAQFGGQGCQ